MAQVPIFGAFIGCAVGMLIFIPITSVAYMLFRETGYARLWQKKIKV